MRVVRDVLGVDLKFKKGKKSHLFDIKKPNMSFKAIFGSYSFCLSCLFVVVLIFIFFFSPDHFY